MERLQAVPLAECADPSAEPDAIPRGFAEVDTGVDSRVSVLLSRLGEARKRPYSVAQMTTSSPWRPAALAPSFMSARSGEDAAKA